MANLTLYDAQVPYLHKGLDALDAILTKAETHAKEKGIDCDAEYVGARLYEDMGPLAFQVQTVTDVIRAFTLPLVEGAGAEEWPRDEKTFAELHARLDKARGALQTLKPEHVNPRAEEVVNFKLRAMKVSTMLTGALVPNTFFHVTTAYDILRMKGVPLGKMDYIAPFLNLNKE